MLDRSTTIKLYSKLHVAVYKVSRGRLTGRFNALPILLLTTTGRRSGARRATPLGYIEDGSDLVVIASNGGQERHPGWLHNIESNGEVEVQIKGQTRRMTAVVASPEEHARLWPEVLKVWPGYASYQARTSRKIRLVILRPRSKPD